MPAVYEPSSELNVLGTYRRCGLPDSVKVSLSQELGDGLYTIKTLVSRLLMAGSTAGSSGFQHLQHFHTSSPSMMMKF